MALKVQKLQGFWELEDRSENFGSRRCHVTEDGVKDVESTMK